MPRCWPQSTVVCLGAGPSLRYDDVRVVQRWRNADYGRYVIVVNNAETMAPWADLLYASDAWWWNTYRPTFEGLKVGGSNVSRPGVLRVKAGQGRGLSLAPPTVASGGHSGYQAVNLAVLLGATRIVLLGYDCCFSDTGRTHFFGNHRHGSIPPVEAFAEAYDSMVDPLREAGVEVVNATRTTAITAFPRLALEAALDG